MPLNKILLPSAILAALLSTTTAIADVTAQDVWADWQTNMDAYGGTAITTGSETFNNGVLTITDLAIQMDDPNQEIAVEANLPSLIFTEQGDGTVRVTMDETYSFSMLGPDNATMRGSLTHRDMEFVVSGTPADLVYDMSAARYAFTLDEVTASGEPVAVDLTVAFNNMTGQYSVRPGAIREIDYDVAVGTTDIFFDINAPEDDVVMNLSGQIAELGLTASLAMPEALNFEDPDNIDLSGINVEAGYNFGQMAYIFAFSEAGDTANGSAQANGGSLELVFNENEVAYTTDVKDVAINLESSEIPFPIVFAAETYGINFGMPLSRTEAPAPFELGINLTALDINDDIWAMADPSGQFPHDPVTAQIGFSGTAKWLFDLLDPEQQLAMAQSDMPIEPHSVQIDVLNIDALGLQLTGEGGFTFDNTAPGPIPGLPKPEGRVSVSANGVNSLLDNLVAMGMVPQGDVSNIRLMMGLFANATGNDGLTSSLEINAEGHIIVNGQRIQ